MFAHQVSAWQTIQWMRDPQPIERAESFPPFQCDYKVPTFITSFLPLSKYFAKKFSGLYVNSSSK